MAKTKRRTLKSELEKLDNNTLWDLLCDKFHVENVGAEFLNDCLNGNKKSARQWVISLIKGECTLKELEEDGWI